MVSGMQYTADSTDNKDTLYQTDVCECAVVEGVNCREICSDKKRMRGR